MTPSLAETPLAQLRKGLREHRRIHEQWVTHLEHCAGCEDCAAKVVAQVGDLATHRAHLKFYDDALALLTDLEAALEGPIADEGQPNELWYYYPRMKK